MQRQRHQSAIRVWRSNYVNFILECSKDTHRRRCSTSEVWGSRSWLFSPATVILCYQQGLPPSTPISNEEMCCATVANSWLETAPLTSIQNLHPLCRWRDKCCGVVPIVV
ncbi:hypothetical protein Zmor_023213 [Zophobas morio]|uniref:Uncharacterized protein n=1 Tax=Zophobas morio TaxID=2755281 RepID=A0AA38HWI7_9CUCU|nr:hypothetical protein Zmor_023213 [Zophobas morio]